jgi:hypothetical protein
MPAVWRNRRGGGMKHRIVRIRFTSNGRSYTYRATRQCKKGEQVRVYPCGHEVIRPVIGFGRMFYFGHLEKAYPVKEEK